MAYVDKVKLEKDLKKYGECFCRTYANKAADEITKFAKVAIEQFYNDYSPLYYNRTDDLKNNSYFRYYKDNGKTVRGGVRISSKNMKDYVNGNQITSAYDVATWTWLHGYHGYLRHDPMQRIYTFPPVVMVEMAIGDPVFQQKLIDTASNKAKKLNYSVLFNFK